MPLKQPKPKTQQQVEELIELLQNSKDRIQRGCCFNCDIAIALYRAAIDALLWSVGRESKDYGKVIRRLRLKHTKLTQHQCPHSE